MTCITVKTQPELDAALAATGDSAPDCVHIESKRGVWLNIRGNNGKSVVAWDSSSVVAWGSSSVVAWGSSSVVAWGSSSVEAWGSSSVVARGSSSVEAWDSSSVEAWDSSSVVAWGATRVSARDKAKVNAGPHVAVHLHSGQATVTGGVLIDLTALDLNDAATWCAHHGVTVTDGRAVLYKATDSELTRGIDYGKPTVYTVGTDVTAIDWRADNECGGGLHVSPHPALAGDYASDVNRAERRYLRVTVALDDLGPISADKAKARTVRVVAEVDMHGRELSTAIAAA